MMSGSWRRPVNLLGIFFVVVTAGCSPRTVQEDRSINYSSEGGGVAFQHGEEGVYVASSDGESLQQIHDASDALAVSSPLWSPDDERLIFTTALPVETEAADVGPLPAAWDADPEGRRFAPQQVTYTCWLREASGEGQPPQPSAIFTARCDHPGYVAANLAVRWHPSGERILFVDQDDQGAVSLFEFDLRSKSKRRLIEQRARALTFDWSPNHTYLTCSLFGVRDDPAHDGIWVRSEEESEWWQVPRSGVDTPHKNVLNLELLRETRPAWTAEDEQFAFISVKESAAGEQSRTVLRATPASRTVTEVYASDAPIADLRWRPDSRQLTFVEGRPGALRTLDETGEVAEPMGQFDFALTKLGRDAEAEQRLKAFRQSMTLQWEEEDLDALWLDLSDPEAKTQFARVVDFVTPVLQSAYMTEVFLSLDAAEDGAAFFKQQAETAATDAERFASLVCLSQLMLASETHEEYAELVTSRLAPLAARLGGSQNFPLPAEGRGGDQWAAWAEQTVVTIGGGIAGLPMASPEFLERLPEDQVRRWLSQWQTMREDAKSDTARLAADIVIHASLVRLGDDRQQELRKRIAASPLEFLPNEQEVTAEIEDLIQQVRGFASTVTGSR